MVKKPNIFNRKKIINQANANINDMGISAEDKMEKHFFKRLANLTTVKRFVIGWLVLMLLILLVGFLQIGVLRNKYQRLTYVSGGTFTEGLLGNYTNANPMYASGSVDSSVSKLIFSGLFSYDSQQNLSPDLAEKIVVDQSEKVYTVTLKKDLVWQDGQPLTAKDVVFTFKTIQNPQAKSYLLSSWQGIKVESPDDRTVTFTLPGSLSSFPNSLTTGIVPEHILKGIAPEQLRSSDFNTVAAVGSGPFSNDAVEVQEDKPGQKQEQIGLLANKKYYKGEPGIKRYIIKTFDNQQQLLNAYEKRQLDAVSGLNEADKELAKKQDNNIYSVPLSGQTMVFFKNSQGILADANVRKALVLGSDRQKVIQSTGSLLRASDEPLLKSQLGYDKNFAQKTNDTEGAKKILDEAGWKAEPNTGNRSKDGVNLKIKLFAQSNNEYKTVADELEKQWDSIGVDTEVVLQDDEDLKNTISGHSYDALLSTISLGVDPDVFAFWHSSQVDVLSKSRLNFSEYKSQKADAALEAGRSRSDNAVRITKYKSFLEAWSQDNPALALYQPNYKFIVRSPFNGFNSNRLSSPIDRYNNVHEWMIRQEQR